MIKLLILVCALLLSSCALFTEEIAKSAELVGDALSEYCDNMPASERPAFKEAVEAEFGGTIDLTCP